MSEVRNVTTLWPFILALKHSVYILNAYQGSSKYQFIVFDFT